jgi:hypothetical protein
MSELVSLQLETPLREKVELLAHAERRDLENEALCLIENGLAVFEARDNPETPDHP